MRALIYILLLLVAACGSQREILLARSAVVPVGTDLSGNWRLRTPGQPVRSTDSAVDVFVESGQDLKITQTASGLFISFDRAIVEEYRFGEQREVSIGPIVADRVSGWEGGAYVIETLDQDGNKLVESWRLDNDDNELQRTLLIRKKDANALSLRQRYDRIRP